MKKILNFVPATIFVAACFLPGSAISYTTVNTPSQPSSNSATTPKSVDKTEMSPKEKDSKTDSMATQKPEANKTKAPQK